MPSGFFEYLASQAEGDEELLAKCYRTWLERFPYNQDARDALVAMGVDVPELPEREDAVEIPKELLESYAGSYLFARANVSIVVSVDEGKLMINRPGEESLDRAYSLSPSRFLVGDEDIEMKFEIGEDKVSSIIVNRDGREFVFKRTEDE